MSTVITLVVVAAVLNGIVAGVFFAFSSFVMRGLDQAPAPVAVAAMQGINRAAPNPLFALALFGGPLLGLVAAGVALGGDRDVLDAWVVVGAAAGVLSTIVTGAFHIPRNDGLSRVDPAAADAPAVWARYRREWVAGNHVRGLLALVSSVALIVAVA